MEFFRQLWLCLRKVVGKSLPLASNLPFRNPGLLVHTSVSTSIWLVRTMVTYHTSGLLMSGITRLKNESKRRLRRLCLVGGLEHLDYFSIQLGIILPTDFHIFQRGGSTTNQVCIFKLLYICCTHIRPSYLLE